MKKELKIEGMSCGHCKAAVEKALNEVIGVIETEVDLEKDLATVHLNREVGDDALRKAVEDAGYKVVSIS